MTLQDKLKDFSHLDQVKFALFCAKQVVHLNSDPCVKAALSAAEAWVEDPSEDNRLKCKEAAADAWEADVAAADAAWAAAYAATDIADVRTAWVAAWVAADAAYYTVRANPELTKEGLFQSWLNSLILEG
jgi:hypothetical protein